MHICPSKVGVFPSMQVQLFYYSFVIFSGEAIEIMVA